MLKVGFAGRVLRGMAQRVAGALLISMALLVASAGDVRAEDQKPPYWVSINRASAIMRRGPSTEMRAMWEYRRMGLPLRVIAVRDDWRQVQDPGGVVGWMHKRLLTNRRTAIVISAVQPMRTAARPDAPIAFRAEPGVVGRISDCAAGWCLFDVMGQSGWIAADGIWGDEAP